MKQTVVSLKRAPSPCLGMRCWCKPWGCWLIRKPCRCGDEALGDDEVSCGRSAEVLSMMYQRANSYSVTDAAKRRVSVQWKMTLVVSHWPGLSHTGQTQNGLGYKGEWTLAIGVQKMQVGWQWRKFAVQDRRIWKWETPCASKLKQRVPRSRPEIYMVMVTTESCRGLVFFLSLLAS